MASGHPDWREYEGGTPRGTSISIEDFSKSVTTGATGTVDITAVAELDEVYYNLLVISAPDDSAIHRVKLTRISDGAVLFDYYFVTGGIFDLSSVKLLSEEQLRISITNNAAGTLVFKGVISWASRYTYYTTEPPGGGSESCFLAGTKILMDNLDYKNIEDVRIGDVVTSYDFKSKAKTRQKVTEVRYYNADIMENRFYIIINRNLKAVPNQLIFANGVWKRADKLMLGDLLQGLKGYKAITSIKRVNKKVLTYDLQVENTFSYYAEGVLVHNLPACPV